MISVHYFIACYLLGDMHEQLGIAMACLPKLTCAISSVTRVVVPEELESLRGGTKWITSWRCHPLEWIEAVSESGLGLRGVIFFSQEPVVTKSGYLT